MPLFEDEFMRIYLTQSTTQSGYYVIDELDPKATYTVWMFAANELGFSNITRSQPCTPLARPQRTMGTATSIASSLKNDGLNVASLLGICVSFVFRPFMN